MLPSDGKGRFLLRVTIQLLGGNLNIFQNQVIKTCGRYRNRCWNGSEQIQAISPSIPNPDSQNLKRLKTHELINFSHALLAIISGNHVVNLRGWTKTQTWSWRMIPESQNLRTGVVPCIQLTYFTININFSDNTLSLKKNNSFIANLLYIALQSLGGVTTKWTGVHHRLSRLWTLKIAHLSRFHSSSKHQLMAASCFYGGGDCFLNPPNQKASASPRILHHSRCESKGLTGLSHTIHQHHSGRHGR